MRRCCRIGCAFTARRGPPGSGPASAPRALCGRFPTLLSRSQAQRSGNLARSGTNVACRGRRTERQGAIGGLVPSDQVKWGRGGGGPSDCVFGGQKVSGGHFGLWTCQFSKCHFRRLRTAGFRTLSMAWPPWRGSLGTDLRGRVAGMHRRSRTCTVVVACVAVVGTLAMVPAAASAHTVAAPLQVRAAVTLPGDFLCTFFRNSDCNNHQPEQLD